MVVEPEKNAACADRKREQRRFQALGNRRCAAAGDNPAADVSRNVARLGCYTLPGVMFLLGRADPGPTIEHQEPYCP